MARFEVSLDCPVTAFIDTRPSVSRVREPRANSPHLAIRSPESIVSVKLVPAVMFAGKWIETSAIHAVH